jgi:DNA-binding transcriptional regulator LsrR (DeoR family)
MPKVDTWMRNRIIELIEEKGLTQVVVSKRLGISTRTIRIYLQQHRNQQSVLRENSPETPNQTG